MAEVFLGYQLEGGLRKPVAIKRLLPQLVQDRELVALFTEEARLLAQLDHPNIVKTFGSGRIRGQYYMAMEFVHGASLDGLLTSCRNKGQAIPLELLARIGAEVCAALSYAHGFSLPNGTPLNLIHRDISPQNVMLTYQGRIKVLDFGLAADLNALGRTRPAVLAGKTAYLSPEQVKQLPDLDLRTDLYSLGCLLFELATGVKPFAAPSELDTMLAIVKQPTPDPRALDPRIPDEFAEIVLQAMDKDRTRRIQTSQALQAALEGFLEARRAEVPPKALAAFLRAAIPLRSPAKRATPVPDAGPSQPDAPLAAPAPEPAPQAEAAPAEVPDPTPELVPEPAPEPAPEAMPVTQDQPHRPLAGLASPRRTGPAWLFVALGLSAGAALAGYLYLELTPSESPAGPAAETAPPPERTEPAPLPEPAEPESRTDPAANPPEDELIGLVPVEPRKAPAGPRPRPWRSGRPGSKTRPKQPPAGGGGFFDVEPHIEAVAKEPVQPPEQPAEPPADRPPDRLAPIQAPIQTPMQAQAPVQVQVPEKPTYQAPEVVKRRRIAGRDPIYPPMARTARLRATLLVKIFIDPDGQVGFHKFLKTHPVFEEPVVEAIRTWRFSPYTINARPVGTYTVYKFVFQVD